MKKTSFVFLISTILLHQNVMPQKVGIGTKSPENTLHVFKGSAGSVTGFSAAPLIVENSANSYINILAPDANATGILFGKPANNISGGIIYNDVSFNPNGFDFRINGNITRMVLNNAGNLGLGTLSPGARLHVSNGSAGAVSGYIYAPLIVENSTHSYINILAPDNSETGILFGKPASNVSGGIIYNNSSIRGGFQFRTQDNTTQMVLASTGNLGVGVENPGAYKFKISYSNDNPLGANGLDIENTSTSFSGYRGDWEIYTSPTNIGSDGDLQFFYNGNLRAGINSYNGQYQALSDERLKINIKPMPSMLDKIDQLKPSTYQFKGDKKARESNGFIAQDVMKLFPDLVTHNVSRERKYDIYTMNYSGFGVIAIKGIQELQVIIEEQNKKITTLEDRLQRLETALAKITSDSNLKTSK